MAKPSLLEAFLRGSPWPSPGQRGSACAASAWRTCGGAEVHVQAAPVAHAHVFRPERLIQRPYPHGRCPVLPRGVPAAGSGSHVRCAAHHRRRGLPGHGATKSAPGPSKGR
eukprot:2113352-Alexandrium_andersonii.AAC.1